MARQCDICGKKPVAGNNVSHSKRHTKRRFKPNLKILTLVLNGIKKRHLACTSCIKTYSRRKMGATPVSN